MNKSVPERLKATPRHLRVSIRPQVKLSPLEDFIFQKWWIVPTLVLVLTIILGWVETR